MILADALPQPRRPAPGGPFSLEFAAAAGASAPCRRGAIRPPTRLARARVLRLHSLHGEHLHRQGMGLRRRAGTRVQSYRARRAAVARTARDAGMKGLIITAK